jgi:triphosphatase
MPDPNWKTHPPNGRPPRELARLTEKRMEIEAKFALVEPVSAERVEALDWGTYRLGERHTIDQHDTFFDTPEQALRHSRHAVRLRVGGTTPLVTLKGPGSAVQGVHSREEWEAPADDPAPERWPSSIRQKLDALIGSQALQPLLAVQNRRRSWELLGGDRLIAELALDEGEIRAGDRHEPMHELEIELKGGTRADLAEICALVQRQLPARTEDRSKFARGLALMQALPSTQADDTAAQREHNDE